MELNYQKGEVAVSLEENQTVIINNGNARSVKLPEYGEIVIKVNGGNVVLFEVKDQHKF